MRGEAAWTNLDMSARRRPAPAAMALVFALAFAGWTAESAAYVRATTDAGVTFAWAESCVALTAYPSNFVDMMPLGEIQGAANGAAGAWSFPGTPCTDIAMTVTTSSAAPPLVVPDGMSSIIFRTSVWCLLRADGTCDPASNGYDSATLALTTVSSQGRRIYSADIEVNASDHRWADLVAHPELFAGDPSLQDLQNALTHEMGHVLGFAHTCVLGGTLPVPLDNLGNPIPDCAAASPEVVATTMFPSATPGDTGKRTLAPDDQQAACDVYPASKPLPCVAPDSDGGCGCTTARSSGRVPAAATIVLLGCLLARARRRRAPGRQAPGRRP